MLFRSEALGSIVEGTWDREAYKEEMAEMEKVNEAFAEIRALLGSGKGDEAADLVDRMIADARNPMVKARLQQVRGQLDGVRLQMAIASGGEGAAEAFDAMVEKVGDEPERLNELAWMVVQMTEQGAPIGDDVKAAALAAAEKGAKLDPDNGPILDTLAHLYAMHDRLDDAIAAQRKAVKAGGVMAEPMKAYLEELEAKKSGK